LHALVESYRNVIFPYLCYWGANEPDSLHLPFGENLGRTREAQLLDEGLAKLYGS